MSCWFALLAMFKSLRQFVRVRTGSEQPTPLRRCHACSFRRHLNLHRRLSAPGQRSRFLQRTTLLLRDKVFHAFHKLRTRSSPPRPAKPPSHSCERKQSRVRCHDDVKLRRTVVHNPWMMITDIAQHTYFANTARTLISAMKCSREIVTYLPAVRRITFSCTAWVVLTSRYVGRETGLIIYTKPTEISTGRGLHLHRYMRLFLFSHSVCACVCLHSLVKRKFA